MIQSIFSFHRAAALLSILIVLLCAFSIFFLNTWFDEVNYAYKAWLSANELAQPFADFREKYGPIGFYSQAALQGAVGPSIIASRALSAAFFMSSLLVLFMILRRLYGKWWGLLGVALLGLHPYMASLFTSATPYALIALLSLLSIFFLTDTRLTPTSRAVLASLLLTGAFLVRYNMLPALLVLFFCIWFCFRGWKPAVAGIGASLLLSALSLIPYAATDISYMFAALLEMFGPFAALFQTDPYPSYEGVGYFWGNRLDVIVSVLSRYFHFFLISFAGLAVLFSRPGTGVQEVLSFLRAHIEMSFPALAALAVLAVHLLFPGHAPYEIYSLYGTPFLVVISVALLALFWQELAEKAPSILPTASAVLAGLIILTPISIGAGEHVGNFGNPLKPQESDLARVARAGETLRSVTTAQDVVASLDDPYHVFYAERYEIPPLINKFFTYRSGLDKDTLERFKLYDAETFLSWIADTATVVVLQRGEEERLDRVLDDAERARFEEILRVRFEKVAELPHAYPRAYTVGDGVMDIYKKRASFRTQ